jgi:hypothetical protein
MSAFDLQRGYAPDLNVRDFSRLVDTLLHSRKPREGVLYPLIGARRAGKTWALKAIEHALQQVSRRKALWGVLLVDCFGAHAWEPCDAGAAWLQ